MENNLCIILVVYNSLIEKLPILTLAINDVYDDFFFCDNSTNASFTNANQIFVSSLGLSNVFYKQNKENIGLPKNYNFVCRSTRKEWILLMDQDTIIQPDFLLVLKNAISNNPNYQIFAPILIDDSRRTLFSPCLCKGFKRKKYVIGKEPKKPWIIVPVNSGACFNKKVFTKLGGFDEKLFLDFVDFSFFKKAGEQGFNTYILTNLTMIQPFSGTTFSGKIDSVANRFSILKKDSLIYFGKGASHRFRRLILLTKRSLNLTLHYHTLRFLRILFSRKA